MLRNSSPIPAAKQCMTAIGIQINQQINVAFVPGIAAGH